MPPLYDYECKDCGKVHETLVSRDHGDKPIQCPDCGGEALQKPSSFGGYNGNLGGSSTRPKNAGSFKRRKA